MRTLKLYRHGITMGTPPAKNDHLRAKRGVVEGWSESASRRNIQFLRSVDETQLSETGSGEPLLPIALTLTLKDCPATPAEWHTLRTAFLKRMRRLGLYRSHWVTEWQRRGVPHLHGAFWFPPGVHPSQIINHWVELATPYGAGHRGQHYTNVTDAIGWFKYVSKHTARGARHYQRHPDNIPSEWLKRTGRVWGHTGDWPTQDAVEFEMSSEAFHRLRRILRNWRIADARTQGNSWRIKSARQMLKSNKRELSDVRGASEWLEMGPSLAILDYLKAQGMDVSC